MYQIQKMSYKVQNIGNGEVYRTNKTLLHADASLFVWIITFYLFISQALYQKKKAKCEADTTTAVMAIKRKAKLN